MSHGTILYREARGWGRCIPCRYCSVPCREHKPKRLTKAEKEAFLLPETLKQILVGLIMGDLHVYKQKLGINTSLVFEQGLVHKDYIYHLYELF